VLTEEVLAHRLQVHNLGFLDIGEQGKNLVVSSMHREHNRDQNQLGDNRKQYTTDHHYQEVPLVVNHPFQMELIVAIRYVQTSC
jgi:hypothetical protein